MRTKEEFEKVLCLKKEGYNNCEISRLTNIPRSTIKDWVSNPPRIFIENNVNKHPSYLAYHNNELKEKIQNDIGLRKIYSYVLGLYLGDGCIDIFPRTLRLRLFFDAKYKSLNNFIEYKLKKLFYNSKVTRHFHGNEKCIYFSIFCKELKNIFPQMGKGVKYKRKILLRDWQKENICHAELLMGLIHSDGCYYVYDNRDNYSFSNASKDIHNIFQDSCKYFDVNYTVSKNNERIKSTNINKRKDVEKMKFLIGTKTEIKDFFNINDFKIKGKLQQIDLRYISKKKSYSYHKKYKCIECGDNCSKKGRRCINCHRRKIEKQYFCPKCNNKFNGRGKTCRKCYNKSQRKLKRPSYKKLLEEIEQTSYCAVGRKYGVSDNAIRKWIKNYEKEMK